VTTPLLVTSSPHLRAPDTTQSIMRDVLIALLPAVGAGAWFFGPAALLPILLATLGAVLGEYLTRVVFLKRDNRLADLSAVVTGVLLGMNLPPSIPLPLAFLGGLIATALVKEVFGGLGQNFMNPALAARVLLFTAWMQPMTHWVPPHAAFDAATSATPLSILKGLEGAGALPPAWDMFLGGVGGCIGETSALALLVGAAYLVVRRVITLEIPLVYIGTTLVFVWVFGAKTTLFAGDVLTHLLSGGLMLGAWFMATDYATSPVTRKGRIVYAAGMGLLTGLIRIYTNYPEGVSFAILIMNAFAPLIDRYTVPKSFGADHA
jgi:electron transport complex protein RnfD